VFYRIQGIPELLDEISTRASRVIASIITSMCGGHDAQFNYLAATAAVGLGWITAIAQVATAHVVAATPEHRYSNRWRLGVSEGVNSDGVMRFRITPLGGTPIDVHIRLKDGRGDDGCARDIRDAFKAMLDRE
jgi:hypothetical protein